MKLTSNEPEQDVDELAAMLRRHDVAVDFSVGPAVLRNVAACALAGLPLVEGTTGWKDQESHAKKIITEHGGALVYGANFSIGVNVFYRIVTNAAKLLGGLDQYEAFIEEQHHSRKRDAPSGTALKLKSVMVEFI